MSKFNSPKNKKKYLSKVHKIRGTHVQRMNNHYAKFEYQEMKTVECTDYTNQTPSKQFEQKKMS